MTSWKSLLILLSIRLSGAFVVVPSSSLKLREFTMTTPYTHARRNVRQDEKKSKEDMESLMRDGLVEEEDTKNSGRRNLIINTITAGLLAAVGVSSAYLFKSEVYTPSGFQRLGRTQFIAALGDPNASEGTGATEWGLWRNDPGPRGVFLRDYERELERNDNVAPVYNWKFDKDDWWVEEHGIIMEQPEFPLPPGRYLVTGGRMVTTGLTIDEDGNWKLDEGKLYDVTHLPCRSARYTTGIDNGNNMCSPKSANLRNFPVTPGAEMPPIDGCAKQDYAVLFLVGKAA